MRSSATSSSCRPMWSTPPRPKRFAGAATPNSLEMKGCGVSDHNGKKFLRRTLRYLNPGLHFARVFHMRIAVSPLFSLTFAAGCVDAISFVGLGSVFTANMTGNTVLLGIAIVARFTGIHSTLGVVPPLTPWPPSSPARWRPYRCRQLECAPSGADGAGRSRIDRDRGGGLSLRPLRRSGAVRHRRGQLRDGCAKLVAARAGRPGIATTYVTGTIVTAIARGFAHDARDEHRARMGPQRLDLVRVLRRRSRRRAALRGFSARGAAAVGPDLCHHRLLG